MGRATQKLVCFRCGYDLSGAVTDPITCPECGNTDSRQVIGEKLRADDAILLNRLYLVMGSAFVGAFAISSPEVGLFRVVVFVAAALVWVVASVRVAVHLRARRRRIVPFLICALQVIAAWIGVGLSMTGFAVYLIPEGANATASSIALGLLMLILAFACFLLACWIIARYFESLSLYEVSDSMDDKQGGGCP